MVSAPTKTLASVRRSSASRVLLSSREIIDKHEAGLHGVEGARQLIDLIKVRRSVSKLVLGHNSLGDGGCKELFQFLSSDAGAVYKISEISLNSNDIRYEGMEAITDYLRGNKYLKVLYLQNNRILGDQELALKLSFAINSSKLETLSLNTNDLGDDFFNFFICHLVSSTLRELQISTIGITGESAHGLVEFLTSRRAHPLEILKCNGNSLGLDTLRILAKSLRESNFTIRKLEMHAAAWSDADALIAEESVKLHHSATKELHETTIRNELLRNKLHEQALELLRYSRMLLLPLSSSHKDSPKTSIEITYNPKFAALPTELRQYILSFIAPVLSASQCTRVIEYGSRASSLRSILPRLSATSEGCVPDPAILPFNGIGMGGPANGFGIGPGCNTAKMSAWVTSPQTSALRLPRMCDSGKCMGAGGSVFCHRIEARNQWLAMVQCERFDANGRTEYDVLQLLV